jgi:hypothetical protein
MTSNVTYDRWNKSRDNKGCSHSALSKEGAPPAEAGNELRRKRRARRKEQNQRGEYIRQKDDDVALVISEEGEKVQNGACYKGERHGPREATFER